MKIFESEQEPIEFEYVDQGTPFYYGNNRTLCMKVTAMIGGDCHVNAVELKDGKLFYLYDSEMVTIANVHIEDD